MRSIASMFSGSLQDLKQCGLQSKLSSWANRGSFYPSLRPFQCFQSQACPSWQDLPLFILLILLGHVQFQVAIRQLLEGFSSWQPRLPGCCPPAEPAGQQAVSPVCTLFRQSRLAHAPLVRARELGQLGAGYPKDAHILRTVATPPPGFMPLTCAKLLLFYCSLAV